MHEIKVTVLMPAYNTGAYIREAIQSVLNQTFTEFELLIINDGSTDDTEEIIRSLSDPRIVLISQGNAGVSAALNTGLRNARGKYIARFDADDICYPNRLKSQYHFLQENPDYVLIGSDADYIDKNGNYLFYYECIGHSQEEISQRIEIGCPFIHSSVFFLKDIAVEIGGYNERAHSFEDYLLWINFIKRGRVMNFNIPLISVRLNPESVTVDEKLRGKSFTHLKKEILFGNQRISDRQEQELKKIIASQNFTRFKHFSYHILVAKKYLWNNPTPRKAREHLRKAFQNNPGSLMTVKLFILSFLPGKLTRFLYNRSKK
jgi:glycosyltransferase involved in cell wall biosynthesis